MREILFRGKRKDNGEWVYWNMYGEICRLNGKRARIANSKNSGEHYYYYVYQIKQLIIPETIGQYTGLTDKNGKKIFEGDCWLDTDGDYLVYVVDFREGQFGFVCYGVQGILMPYGFDEDAGGFGEIDFTPFTDWNMPMIEISGNIHDNPEFLNGMESESND